MSPCGRRRGESGVFSGHGRHILDKPRPVPARLIWPALQVTLPAMSVLPPVIPFAPHLPDAVSFDRHELQAILSVYGRMVALGEWRDYAITSLKDVAVFSIFRRTAEHPLYRVEKRPRLRGRQGIYSVVGMDGAILRRGHEIEPVLKVLEHRTIRAVE